MRALAYPDLVGEPEPGDRVLLNAGALLMGLGTGGYALVVALPDRLPPDPPQAGDTRDAGHLVKARYTPLQPILLGVDEEASPHRDVLAAADDLDGMPVVTADLHSALPAILAGIHADAPARPGRVPDDRRRRAARLVLPHPRRAARPARRHGHRRARRSAATWRPSPCTAGCSPPGTCSRADVAIVAQGPGNLGTGTRWGFSGVAVGEAVNASPRWAAARSARCASPTPTPAPGTAACRTTASPRTAGWRWPRRTWWCPTAWRRRWPRGRRGAGAAGGAAPARPGAHRRARRRAAGAAGGAVHHGPRPGRRPRLLPGRRRRRPARAPADRLTARRQPAR